MTHEFHKNFRRVLIILSTGVLIFFAGAILTGYKPRQGDITAIILAALHLIYQLVNKPALPLQ
jgi:hypothetical protein